ncbi:MAG TPA: hypothetical protein PKY95_11535, partial [candidate division Zixibacteria bacterium]|nr:hypothetical protein [candidate division Zixibacteria bacterium]
ADPLLADPLLLDPLPADPPTPDRSSRPPSSGRPVVGGMDHAHLGDVPAPAESPGIATAITTDSA